jgi:Ca2+/Na+ antiporter
MEFEALQKIWNEQKGENMYAINETAMHESIFRKKRAAGRRINRVEISLMLINGSCGVFLFIDALNDAQPWDFIGAFIMLCTVVYMLWSRNKRLRQEQTFDRSMIGELDHTIANTDSLLNISKLMIPGYLLPVAVLYLSKLIVTGASLEKFALIIGMFILAFVLVFWERKKMHEPRIKKLKQLREQLK